MSVSEADVRSFVLERIAPDLREADVDPSSLADDTDLLAEGLLDSLGVVELIAVVSDRFGIDDDWDDYDPDDLLIIGSFCRYVSERAVADK